MRRRPWSAAALGAVLAACGSPGDLDDSARLRGVVLDSETLEPLAGVEVRTTPVTERVVTGEDGRFDVSNGVRLNTLYRIDVRRDRYVPQRVDVTPEPNDPVDVEIQLDLIRICTLGEERCQPGASPAAVERCADRGSVYEVVQVCGTEQRCRDGVCGASQTLDVTVQGGVVISEPTGIVCAPTCSAEFAAGSTVRLDAQPFAGSSFVEWGGDCVGTEPICTLTMDSNRTASANFLQNAFGLAVDFTGNGRGDVISDPSGLDCSNDCTRAFDRDSTVTLTATPRPGFEFDGWGRDCSGRDPTCTVTMDGAKEVRARFIVPQRRLRVRFDGPGAGTVTSEPSGVDCKTECAVDFDIDSTVTLSAQPDASNTFVGWSGNCFGTGECVVVLDQDRTVTATFDGLSFALTVETLGDGSGVVTSMPAGIDCGGTCSASFGDGTQVELTASPSAGHRFVGWEGDCSGTGACMVTMDQARTVRARFQVETAQIAVTVNGSGQVTSMPAGIECPGSTCTADFAQGTMVDLEATPAAGQGLASWGGDCAGTQGTVCTVTVDGAKTVDVTFEAFYLLPLAADMACSALFRFEMSDRRLNACGMGASGSETGSWQAAASRVAALGDAYGPTGPGAAFDSGVTLAPPNATVELTVRKDGDRAGDAFAVLLSSMDHAASNPVGFELRAYSDGTLQALTRTLTATTSVATSSATLPLSTWAHVAASLQSDRIVLFVDGSEVARVQQTVSWTGSSSTAWVGARRRGGTAEHTLDGLVDEVRLSDVTRY